MHQKYRQVVFSLSRNKVLNVGLFDMICAVRIVLELVAREMKGLIGLPLIKTRLPPTCRSSRSPRVISFAETLLSLNLPLRRIAFRVI